MEELLLFGLLLLLFCFFLMYDLVLSDGYLVRRNGTFSYRYGSCIEHISQYFFVLVNELLILAYLLNSLMLAVVFMAAVSMSSESSLEFLISLGCLGVTVLFKLVMVIVSAVTIVVMVFVVCGRSFLLYFLHYLLDTALSLGFS